jgi:hypothetical protein
MQLLCREERLFYNAVNVNVLKDRPIVSAIPAQEGNCVEIRTLGGENHPIARNRPGFFPVMDHLSGRPERREETTRARA